MKGLDSWIMGLNDPNAPFNQTDWMEYYSPVIDISDWITIEMCDNPKTYELLGQVFDEAFTLLLEDDVVRLHDGRLSSKQQFVLMQTNDRWLSETAHRLFVEKTKPK